MSTKIYPIGIQNFEKIRKEGYFYVDKTALVYQLVRTGSYYFLSRPRRFGKSLLLSTIEAYMQGKRELFEGLAIEQQEGYWEQGFARGIPQHVEAFLWRAEDAGRLHQVCHADGCHQVWQGERVQRLE